VLLNSNKGNLVSSLETDIGTVRKGLVFNIQRYSIHDGPGIRTTVFFKGCPLRCRWCSNPESINPLPEIMVRSSRCDGCRRCIESCPQDAITLDADGLHLDRARCDQCLKCFDTCQANALEVAGRYVSIKEVLDECIRDEMFYRNSGGGVTLSGGEPLFQAEFAINLLQECKRNGLSTALDTSGYVPWKVLEKASQYTDLVLFDIKNIDNEAHRSGTGADNRLIMDNLEKLVKTGKSKVWIRIPVIPDYNDSEEYMERLAVRLQTIPAEKNSLLGYHEWGRQKYQSLGKNYSLNDCKPPPQERLQILINILKSKGLEVTAGY